MVLSIFVLLDFNDNEIGKFTIDFEYLPVFYIAEKQRDKMECGLWCWLWDNCGFVQSDECPLIYDVEDKDYDCEEFEETLE